MTSADRHDATLLIAAANDTERYELRRALERGAVALLCGDSEALHECGRRAQDGYYVGKLAPCCAAPEASGDCCRTGAHRAARQHEARQARPDWAAQQLAQAPSAHTTARARERGRAVPAGGLSYDD